MKRAARAKPHHNAQAVPPQRRFSFWFARLSRTLSEHTLNYVRSHFGLNLAEHRVLAVLGDDDGMSTRDISAYASLDKGQTARALASLAQRGLVTQHIDEQDRRLRVVYLTASGRETAQAIRPVMSARQNQLMDCLNEAEQKMVWPILQKLFDEAERLRRDGEQGRFPEPLGTPPSHPEDA
ncbi:MarR family winged helix-turn-helix transcriptional regulator [Alkalilimnicola sp. S0819]|uniref:MarR family winged helix-turn-helix transcriptional regulator n=1 Tax=Alkalilimnicola sp. S0819 TaxID=2613922 RepID=UPI00126184B2|nr:MarR family winged helix-turn-helix transcriptional regulator [Alkalilimnicola sp. S0819]KAB7623322.1 winged helix-turn-helix transcriptional regulator [Alkalilimnicola sp. S0819]MPQ16860.1 MarR family transcriptional regulator [Alkalilimnicola sp. S0819]